MNYPHIWIAAIREESVEMIGMRTTGGAALICSDFVTDARVIANRQLTSRERYWRSGIALKFNSRQW
jgi:hypothetical protein